MSFLSKEITLPRLRVPKLQSPQLHRPRLRGPQRSSRGSRAVTGLEIGATQVIAAEAHLANGRILADRTVARPLPPGLVRDGLVINVEGLASELRELFSEHGFDKRVRVGLATPRTVLRVIDLPPLDDADIASALPMLAQDTIPMPLDRAVLDYQSVGLVDTPDGRRLRVIVVAAEREGVETIANTLELAGLRPIGIDLSVFAAIRAVTGGEIAPGPVLYAQLGDLVNLAISENGVCRFTRQAPHGLALILSQLADQRDITIEAAQSLLATAAGDTPGDASADDLRDVGALLARMAKDLASEFRATAEFYGTQFGTTVTEGVVTGPLTTLRGFVDALADASGMSLRAGEVTMSGDDVSDMVDARVAPVSVGLAVAQVAA